LRRVRLLRLGAYQCRLRTFETHALKAAVGDLLRVGAWQVPIYMCRDLYEAEGEGGDVGAERYSRGDPVMRLLSLLRLLHRLLHLFLSSHLLRLQRQQRLELNKEARKGYGVMDNEG